MPKETSKQLMDNGFHVYFFRNGSSWRVIGGLSEKGPWSYLSKLEKTSAENHDKGNVFKQAYSKEYKITTAETDSGFIAEIHIPWNTVGGKPAHGENIGFNAVRINKQTGTTYVW